MLTCIKIPRDVQSVTKCGYDTEYKIVRRQNEIRGRNKIINSPKKGWKRQINMHVQIQRRQYIHIYKHV
jgi:hypothetical protein